ncbi:hypothetical protein B0J13DRAFT_643909 [Dactylonectria estremocensis]|uniref:Uncharacterized protein n=1 Tax=Dactylonectria estremocensis TaxID=1079267 RepID=A0A9P9JCI5_9HYPO|nr:hypothetical protein B0J13DRAFT_643909 [Dactylonectria estremocensis]
MAPCKSSKPHSFDLRVRGLDFDKNPDHLVAIILGVIALIALGIGMHSLFKSRREFIKTQQIIATHGSVTSLEENRILLRNHPKDYVHETPKQQDLRIAVDREIAKHRAQPQYPPNEPPAAPRLMGQAAPRLSLEMSEIDLNDSATSTTPVVPPKAIVRHESPPVIPPANDNWPLRNSIGPAKDAGSKLITPQDRLKLKLGGGSRN